MPMRMRSRLSSRTSLLPFHPVVPSYTAALSGMAGDELRRYVGDDVQGKSKLQSFLESRGVSMKGKHMKPLVGAVEVSTA